MVFTIVTGIAAPPMPSPPPKLPLSLSVIVTFTSASDVADGMR